MKNRLIVMVKEPRPGRVKTRLGKDLGMVQAATWYRQQTLSTLRRLTDPRWQIVLAVSPDKHAQSSTIWPSSFERVPQGKGSLGDRMLRLLKSSKMSKTCIIGSDIPDIQRAHISASFAGLGSHSSVIGPAFDGGYWLVGVRHPQRLPLSFLKNVRWSSEHALEDTLRSAPQFDWLKLDKLDDIDTHNDLQHYFKRQKRNRASWFISGS